VPGDIARMSSDRALPLTVRGSDSQGTISRLFGPIDGRLRRSGLWQERFAAAAIRNRRRQDAIVDVHQRFPVPIDGP
jgi:hypothetical protein